MAKRKSRAKAPIAPVIDEELDDLDDVSLDKVEQIPDLIPTADLNMAEPMQTFKQPAPAQKNEKKAAVKKVTMEFDDNVSAEDMEKTMKMAGKMAADNAERRAKIDEGVEFYRKNGGRRWRCQVNSLQPGVKSFSMTVGHPKTGKPIMVQGMCGRILEDGLTKFMIDRLHGNHSFRMEEILDVNPLAPLALTHKQVKVPHYSVDIYEEIKNPKSLGKAGIRR